MMVLPGQACFERSREGRPSKKSLLSVCVCVCLLALCNLLFLISSGWLKLLFFYRTGSGSEIDFVIETRKRQRISKAHIVCLEVKLAETWDRRWERPRRSLSAHDNINVDKMAGIYTGKRAYHFDGIDVLPLNDFLDRLHEGEIF
jgi:hypothetical protein